MTAFDVTDDEPRDGVQRLTLNGELDLGSAYAFDKVMLDVEARNPKLIIVDLRELTMLDSAGLARLVSAQRRARKGGWRLVLVKGGKTIQRILQLTQLVEHFDIARDMQSALGKADGGPG